VLASERIILATPNYGYEKRQKELAKKRKKEDKLKAKSERKLGEHGEELEQDGAPGEGSDSESSAVPTSPLSAVSAAAAEPPAV
jgi:hypothetical protein